MKLDKYFFLRFNTCSSCNGNCKRLNKFSFEIILYDNSQTKHLIVAHKKRIDKHAQVGLVGEVGAGGVLARFNHLKKKRVRIHFFENTVENKNVFLDLTFNLE